MAERTDKEREARLREQQEDIARAQQGLPPKNNPAASDPKPEALPITERQQEEIAQQDRVAADKRAAQENKAAKATSVAEPHPNVAVQRGVQGSTRSKK